MGDIALHVLVHVDDLIITYSSSLAIANFKQKLSPQFHMKEFAILKYFLGIKVAYGRLVCSFPMQIYS